MTEKIDRAALRALINTASQEVFLRDYSPHPHEERNEQIQAARSLLARQSRTALPALLDALEASEARERRLREALRSMQIAAAAGLDIVRDESSPVFEFLAAIHRHSTAALIADAEPTNEAETGP